jgi:hypothetical protein
MEKIKIVNNLTTTQILNQSYKRKGETALSGPQRASNNTPSPPFSQKRHGDASLRGSRF